MRTRELAEGMEDAGGGSMTQQPYVYPEKLPTGDGGRSSFLFTVRILRGL